MIGGVEQRLPGFDVPNVVLVDDFGPVDAESGEAEPKGQGFALDLLSFKGLEAIPDLEWVIDGWIPKGGLTMIYGPPKSGKSFIVMALVLALDHGERWLGHPVDGRCRSLYVALEGRSGLKIRSEAWHEYFERDVEAGQSLIQTGRVNLAEYEHTDAIIDAVTEHGIELVIIDTLAKATSGMDENSAKDMGRIIDQTRRIQEETGATVILVHHTGHGDTNRERGSSALAGAVDSSILVKTGKMSAPLVKDGRTPEPVHFKLEPAGQSVVALPVPIPALDSDDDVHEEGLQNDLEKIRNVLEDEGQPMPKNAIHRQIGGNRQRIIGSINVWVERGFLTKTTEGRSQLIGLPG